MKKLLILLFSILISFNSYANWELLVEDIVSDGYIDKQTITEQNGYVYFWILQNNHKPDEFETMSTKVYTQGDCGINSSRFLTFLFYIEPMGEGKIDEEITLENPKWEFAAPDSISGFYLNYVCNYLK